MIRILCILAFICLALPHPARADEALAPKAADATKPEPQHLNSAPMVIESADGTKHQFTVELALTQQQMVTGLMYRTSMPDATGMIFLFDDSDERTFWMKDTLIPLDMLFIDDHGRIFHIHENAVPNDLTAIPSQGPARAVLELNAGIVKKLGLKVGDVLHYKAFAN